MGCVVTLLLQYLSISGFRCRTVSSTQELASHPVPASQPAHTNQASKQAANLTPNAIRSISHSGRTFAFLRFARVKDSDLHLVAHIISCIVMRLVSDISYFVSRAWYRAHSFRGKKEGPFF